MVGGEALLGYLPVVDQLARAAGFVRASTHDDIVERFGGEPLTWSMTLLGYDGYHLRAWFEPIEDEL